MLFLPTDGARVLLRECSEADVVSAAGLFPTQPQEGTSGWGNAYEPDALCLLLAIHNLRVTTWYVLLLTNYLLATYLPLLPAT